MRGFSKWLLFFNSCILFIFPHWFLNASNTLHFLLCILPSNCLFSSYLTVKLTVRFKALTHPLTHDPFAFPQCLNAYLLDHKPETHLLKPSEHLLCQEVGLMFLSSVLYVANKDLLVCVLMWAWVCVAQYYMLREDSFSVFCFQYFAFYEKWWNTVLLSVLITD